jgi:hypothetical protein
MVPAPLRHQGYVFSKHRSRQPPPCLVPSRPCNKVSIAGQQGRWHQASRAIEVPGLYGQACCEGLGTAPPDSKGDAVSRTPAAGLARLKVQHPGWVIRRRVLPGQATGYTAHRKFSRGGFQSLHTVTLGGLEQALFLAEKGMLDEAGGRRPLLQKDQDR